LHEAQDHGGLLLLATAAGNADMVAKLGLQADQAGKHNVSFLSYFLLGDLERCLEILLTSNRIPEAAFFARTYLPSEISRVVEMWRVQLGKVNEKAGQSLADPKDYANLFPDYEASLQAQQMLAKERTKVIPAEDWKEIMANYERKPLEELNALADEEEMIDEVLDDKDHPIAGAIGLREELTGGNFESDDETEEVAHRSGGEGRASMDDSVEADNDNDSDVDKDYNSEEDLDKLLDEELDDLDIGEPSKLDTVSGITTEDLEAELEMDLDNLKLDDIDTTDVNLDDEELLED